MYTVHAAILPAIARTTGQHKSLRKAWMRIPWSLVFPICLPGPAAWILVTKNGSATPLDIVTRIPCLYQTHRWRSRAGISEALHGDRCPTSDEEQWI